MGLTIKTPGAEAARQNEPEAHENPAEAERARLLAELAALTMPEEHDENRELREEVEYRRIVRAAAPHERIGRLKLEPGQLCFRQMMRAEFKRIDECDKVPPGRPPMTEAQAADANRIVSEEIFRACLKSPSWDEFQNWLIKYPTAMAEYGLALNDHNKAHRREREAK